MMILYILLICLSPPLHTHNECILYKVWPCKCKQYMFLSWLNTSVHSLWDRSPFLCLVEVSTVISKYHFRKVLQYRANCRQPLNNSGTDYFCQRSLFLVNEGRRISAFVLHWKKWTSEQGKFFTRIYLVASCLLVLCLYIRTESTPHTIHSIFVNCACKNDTHILS